MNSILRPVISTPIDTSETLCFQVLTVSVNDIALPKTPNKPLTALNNTDYEEMHIAYLNNDKKAFQSSSVVYMNGVTATGLSVCVEVHGFQPSFYVELLGAEKPNQLAHRLRRILHNDMMKIEFVKRYQLTGWEPESLEHPEKLKKHVYARVYFKNMRQLYISRNKLERASEQFEVHESRVAPYQMFMSRYNLRACCWVGVHNFTQRSNYTRTHPTQLEVVCDLNNGGKLMHVEDNAMAPILVASFDIEVNSSNCCTFPDFKKPGDEVILIGVTFYRVGTATPVLRAMLCLNDVEMPENSNIMVRTFGTERELLLGWRDLMLAEDPDMVVSYNGYGFDCQYLYERHRLTCLQDRRFLHLGRQLAVRSSGIVEKRLSSEALGDNVLNVFSLPGRVQMDLMQELKKNYKLSSYRLDDVVKHFMPTYQAKLELDIDNWVVDSVNQVQLLLGKASEFFDATTPWAADEMELLLCGLWEAGNERPAVWKAMDAARDAILAKLSPSAANKDRIEHELLEPLRSAMDACGDDNYKKMFRLYRRGARERGKIVEYCQQDCDLVVQLMDFLCVVPNMLKMGEVTYTLPDDIANRGQQIKVFNLLVRFASRKGYVVNIEDVGYRGDTNYKGATVMEPSPGFYEDNIITMDFASLYPSIMRGYNLCLSSLVVKRGLLANLDTMREHGGVFDSYKMGAQEFVFQRQTEGVVPQILTHLLAARAEKKREMRGTEKGSDIYKLLNAEQLALKISCNSVYGFFGANPDKSIISCIPMAMATTTKGREIIEQTKAYVEQHYNYRVIYGDTDSVMVQYPFDKSKSFAANMEASFAKGSEMAAAITQLFPAQVVLEFEKVYNPYLLLKKKNYVGMKYEDSPTAKPSMDAKGIASVRRDNCGLLRRMLSTVLKMVLEDMLKNKQDPQVVYNYVQTQLQAFVDGKVPLSELVITRALKSDYKNDCQAHVQVVKKMLERQAFDVPRSGDRVPYVILEGKSSQVSMRAEHPKFVADHPELKIDKEYYLGQLRDALCRVLDHLPIPPTRNLFHYLLMQVRNKRNGNQSILQYIEHDNVPMHMPAKRQKRQPTKRSFSMSLTGERVEEPKRVSKAKRVAAPANVVVRNRNITDFLIRTKTNLN